MKKNFILDTNVLIHDPKAIYAFADNNVIIPITVIEELDSLKTSNRTDLGRNARASAREIDKYRGKLSKGALLPNGGTLKVIVKNDIEDAKAFPLFKTIQDNKILYVAYKIHNENAEVPTIFVSKDLNARIKADALGITTNDYEKQKVDIEALYSGYTEIQVKPEHITNFFKDKRLEVDSVELYNNQYVLLTNITNPNNTALARYSEVEKAIVPLEYDGEDIWGVRALNKEQRFAYDALLRDDINVVSLVGQAGTGKTLIAIACGLFKTLDDRKYKQLVVTRPIIPMGKDIGYLPGSKDEKLHFWMQPIFDNLKYIFQQSDTDNKGKSPDEAIKYLMSTNLLELEAMTYIRGRSIPKCYIIIDEAQNLSPHEIKTLISRAGENTKIVLTGDPYQIDHPYLDANSNGLSYLVERFKGQSIYAQIQLIKSERSKLASIAAELL